jgi:pimeloyl-ACP methyl ester carboxylesterase
MRDHTPIVHRSVQLGHGRVAYLTVDRPAAEETVLLIHGAGVSARTWVHQLTGLGDTLRPIAIDLPGRGESDPLTTPTLARYAESAARLLDHLGTGPAFVAGHSLGGGVAQLLAARHPDRVKGLILVSTCARVPPDDGTLRLLGFVPPPFRALALLWTLRRTLLGPTASWSAIDLTLAEVRGCPSTTIAHDTELGRRMDLEPVAAGLRVPALIVCGARDRLTAPALSERLSRLVGGSRLAIVPAAGHMLPLEAPGTLNDLILSFVRGVASEGVRAERRSGLRRLLEWVQRWPLALRAIRR